MSLLPEDHVYSYSQLQSFHECKYGFYLKRIEGIEDEQSNAFAERGSLIHSLLDEWAKGLLSKDDMADEYDRRYGDEVVTAWPRMMKGYAQKAYASGYEFLKNFDEFEGYEILRAEEKYNSEITLPDGSTRPFVGIVDLIVRDEKTDELIIFDHKSKGKSTFKKAEEEMYTQLYMYAQCVKQLYGKFPDRLGFHLFNQEGLKVTRPFDEAKYNEVMEWAGWTIQEIEDATMIDWMECKEIPEGKMDMYCTQLCGARNQCPQGIPPPPKQKDFYYDNNI